MADRSGKRKKALNPEDRALWERVKETVVPLHGRRRIPPGTITESPEAPAQPISQKQSVKPFLPAYRPAMPGDVATREGVRARTGSNIEKPTVRKLAKGRIEIDARIDLHNMTQDEAHMRLARFLADSRARGLRHILVITGKGGSPSSDGILRRMVPQWLKLQPISDMVSGYSVSARHHGGEGALYVRLKKSARI